jgi:hypothetical protein
MNQRFHVLLAASALGAALAVGACGGDSLPSDTQSTATSTGDVTTTTGSDSTSSGGMGGGGGAGGSGGAGGGAPDCFTNPKTHVEIINACTTADEVDKSPKLPLLGPNGELPPLP